MMLQRKNINRRQFLKRTTGIAASTIAFPHFVPSSALGKAGSVAANDRIVMGCIGTLKRRALLTIRKPAEC